MKAVTRGRAADASGGSISGKMKCDEVGHG